MSTPPPPITIVIDTREQAPLDFSAFPHVTTIRDTLPLGDYGVPGFSGRDADRETHRPPEKWEFVIERKSLEDLIGSMTAGRDRFTKELLRMTQYDFHALVIEATFADFIAGHYRSAATPKSMHETLNSLQVRTGIQVVWAGTRAGAAAAVESFARHFVVGKLKDAKRIQQQGNGKGE